MNKNIILIVLCILSTVVTIRVSKTKSKTLSKQNVNDGYINISVDNALSSISVNQTEIDLTKFNLNLGDWTVTNRVPYPFAEGDTVQVTGNNFGDVSEGNPAAIIATIRYLGNDGEMKTLSTSSEWTCNGSPAVVLGENDRATIWFNVKGSYQDSIEPTANWIWSQDNMQVAQCRVTLGGRRNNVTPSVSVVPEVPVNPTVTSDENC